MSKKSKEPKIIKYSDLTEDELNEYLYYHDRELLLASEDLSFEGEERLFYLSEIHDDKIVDLDLLEIARKEIAREASIKRCSICKQSENKHKRIIQVQDTGICDSCNEIIKNIFSDSFNKKNKKNNNSSYIDRNKNSKKIKKLNSLSSPKEYKKILDDYIVGQEKGKIVLSTAMYNHTIRINNPDTKIDKSNVLMISGTGTGKTYLVKTLAENLDIPLAIVNTTSLTSAGYIGEDISSILEKLLRSAGGDIQKAENGIIFLDEIDKNRTSGGGTNGKDVSGKAVQQELLKLIEGDVVDVHPDGDDKQPAVQIDTSNILFIAGGAFVGLKEKPGVQVQGLGSKKIKNENKQIDTEMLVDYGMIHEFIGRFTTIIEMDDLTEKDLVKILKEPKDNVILQYKRLFALSDVELDFTDKALSNIAKEALEKKTGARALKSIVEKILQDYMYNIEEYKDSSIIIDYNYNKYKLKAN